MQANTCPFMCARPSTRERRAARARRMKPCDFFGGMRMRTSARESTRSKSVLLLVCISLANSELRTLFARMCACVCCMLFDVHKRLVCALIERPNEVHTRAHRSRDQPKVSVRSERQMLQTFEHFWNHSGGSKCRSNAPMTTNGPSSFEDKNETD